MKLISQSDPKKCKTLPISAVNGFNIVSTNTTTIVSGTVTSLISSKDLLLNQYMPSTVDYVATLSIVETIRGALDAGYIIINLTPSIATINNNMNLVRVADGTSSILITLSSHRITKRADNSVYRVIGTTSSSFSSYNTGSLAQHCSNYIDSSILTATPVSAMPIFSTIDNSNAIYVRNTLCWANSADLTCISPWNNNTGTEKSGTLISPQHIIFANHFTYPNGTILRFVDNTNNVVNATLSTQAQVGSTDIQIGLLTTPILSTISYAKILPKTIANYLPSLSYNYTIPTLSTNQFKQAIVDDLAQLTMAAQFKVPQNSTRKSFYTNIISGDSGSPSFLIINNQLVLITCWTLASEGPSLIDNYDSINATMSALGGGYQLTDISLNSFNTY